MHNVLRFTMMGVLLLALADTVTGTPAITATANDMFTWFGELVSVDASAGTMTVKSPVAYPEALSQLKQFKAGDRVWVVWSGVNDYSDAVREFRRPSANGKIHEALVTPAVLVSPEPTHQYVTLRVDVPDASLTAIKSVKAGQWVTVTSRQRPATQSEAVAAVRPYNDTSTTSTTN